VHAEGGLGANLNSFLLDGCKGGIAIPVWGSLLKSSWTTSSRIGIRQGVKVHVKPAAF
jgi:hypothetical protein